MVQGDEENGAKRHGGMLSGGVSTTAQVNCWEARGVVERNSKAARVRIATLSFVVAETPNCEMVI